MTLEILAHLAAFDLAWFVWLVLANPYWLFAFVALFFFTSYTKKKNLACFLLFLSFFFSAVALAQLIGIRLFALAFPLQYFATAILLASFAKTPIIRNYLQIISLLLLFGVGIATA